MSNNYVKQHEERLGLETYNKQGCLMKIIKYYDAKNITVLFLDDYKTIIDHKTWNEFKLGSIVNPYFKSVYNIGFPGIKYPTKENNQHLQEYVLWHSMFVRCYSDTSSKNRPTYSNAFVNSEWHNYENFYIWIHIQENFNQYISNTKEYSLDKDILFKGNKEYSPDKCLLVPQYVNKLFTKRESNRGGLPIGVHKQGNKYISSCSGGDYHTNIYLGAYDSPNQAFLVYKKYKEDLIKKIAKIEYQNGKITKKCFNAMNKYTVEITD